jgi:hypothetical protein
MNKSAEHEIPVVNAGFLHKLREKHWLRQEGGFDGLIRKADLGDPEPLMRFFAHGPRRLSADQGKQLARLLDKLPLPRRLFARPRGSLKPINAATKYAAYLVRVAAREWCHVHRAERASKNAPRAHWRKQAIWLAEQAFPQLRGAISDDAVSLCRLKRNEPLTDYIRPEILWRGEYHMKLFVE